MSTVTSTELRPLLRGLNALLVGLPLAVLVCVPGAVGDWIRLFIIVVLDGSVLPGMWLLALLPTLGSIGLLVYAVWQLGQFRPEVGEWQADLHHSRLFVLVCLGLAPFLQWAGAETGVPPGGAFVFRLNVLLFILAAFVFLLHLNLLLRTLAMLLPNEVLRADTRIFAKLNPLLLLLVLGLMTVYLVVSALEPEGERLRRVLEAINVQSGRLLILLVLPSVATTLSMIWKSRQTALRILFEPEVFSAPPPTIVGDKEGSSATKAVNPPGDTSCPADAARSPGRE
jgi:hypothetical protein